MILERQEEGDRETDIDLREKHHAQPGIEPTTWSRALTQDLQPFGVWDDTQPTEPPGQANRKNVNEGILHIATGCLPTTQKKEFKRKHHHIHALPSEAFHRRSLHSP